MWHTLLMLGTENCEQDSQGPCFVTPTVLGTRYMLIMQYMYLNFKSIYVFIGLDQLPTSLSLIQSYP